MDLILASGSARRQELMKNCGYEFTVVVSEADESAVKEDDPALLVEKLSLLKARTVFDRLSEEEKRDLVVVGSDTVVVVGGEVIGKPTSEAEAKKMLRLISGREHEVVTGIAVVTSERTLTESDVTKVKVAELTDEEIDAYVRTGEPMDKAGAYGIQGAFSVFAERVEGSYFTVVGLPVHRLYRMLAEVGVRPRG